jgi:hypothetical protein
MESPGNSYATRVLASRRRLPSVALPAPRVQPMAGPKR